MSRRNSVSKELKELVIREFQRGEKQSDIADHLDVNYNTVRSIIFNYNKCGSVERPRGHRKRKLESEQIDYIKSKLEENVHLTREELADYIWESFGIAVCPSTIGNYLHNTLNFSFKRTSPIPERRNDPDVIEQRREYAYKFLNMDRNRSKVFYIDETGIQVHARLNYGWSKKGGRANVPVKAIRGKNYSICAAMNCEGLFFYQVRERAYGTDAFIEYLREFMDKLDTSSITGATVVMDNVPFHHAERVTGLFAATSHELIFLPPYSPFLNPIENLFNQLKHYVKKLKPSSPDEVFNGVEYASQVISPQDCLNYYTNMMKYIPMCLDRREILN
ncbi:uncharacterized protein LOC141857566 [Brevipalpus obovatus]|uniref:uncharacterized protein LOC141854378 n=1 Tax=Brevipalpus obovatus TaxID=246614 RepID=UPI003D9F0925